MLVAAVVLAERPDVTVSVVAESDRVVAGEAIELVVTVTTSVPMGRVARWLPRHGFAEVREPAESSALVGP